MTVARYIPMLVALSLLACAGDDAPDACAPGAVERCGGGDEDCDGLSDEAGAEGCSPYHRDEDGDGQGVADDLRCLCAPVPPYTAAPPSLCGGVSCDDLNPCTTDRCDAATCTHSPREGSCDDADPCTADTICQAGVCGGGTPVTCEDDNPCTIDSCFANVGCHYVPRTGECDDGDRCTKDDQCTPTGCVGANDPFCGEPGCGDGTCNGDETCADCPADCSPLGVGVCGAACDPTGLGATCAPGALCVAVAEDGGPPPSDATGVCVSPAAPCDPWAQTGCAGDESCAMLGSDGALGAAPFCVPRSGSLPAGGDCRADKAACGAGLLCFGGTCAIPCKPSADACPAGNTCRDESDRFDLAAGTWGRCDLTCGDGRCAATEGCESCPTDCGPCEPACGDGMCLGTERCETCSQDCGGCPECGNGQCEPFEDCGRCPSDCGECVCGDGICLGAETCRTCPTDCTVCQCGDGACDANEDCASCMEDCGLCTCGDGLCNGVGEGCLACPADCGACGACGDGICQDYEGCNLCPGDCGTCPSVCGDGVCSGAEARDTCPGDCAAVGCGNGICDEDETCAACPADCRFQRMASCGPACDAVAPDCPTNFVCFPSATGDTANLKILYAGEGICGAVCEDDSDCGDGTCLAISKADVGKVCVPSNAPACNPADPQACGSDAWCMPHTNDPTRGTCIQGCMSRNDDACGGDPAQCHRGTGSHWRPGVCVGQPNPCDVVNQRGCGDSETCVPMSGWPNAGQAYVCDPATGEAELGDPCAPGLGLAATCRAGLLCGTDARCHTPCDPKIAGACAPQTCVDLAAKLWLDPNQVGVCQ